MRKGIRVNTGCGHLSDIADNHCAAQLPLPNYLASI